MLQSSTPSDTKRYRHAAGSITILALGLLWLMGIITAVVYTITMQVEQVLVLRELQFRRWHALCGGMLTGVALLNDIIDTEDTTASATPIRHADLLYDGPWAVDPRHEAFHLQLQIEYEDAQWALLRGELSEKGVVFLCIQWKLWYNERVQKWCVYRATSC